jgi:hypothetical protein
LKIFSFRTFALKLLIEFSHETSENGKKAAPLDTMVLAICEWDEAVARMY